MLSQKLACYRKDPIFKGGLMWHCIRCGRTELQGVRIVPLDITKARGICDYCLGIEQIKKELEQEETKRRRTKTLWMR